MSAEDHALARKVLQRASERDPENGHVLAMLTHITLDEEEYDYNPLPDPLDRALETAQKAVRLEPNSDRTNFALSRAYFAKGQITAALASGERAIQISPNAHLRLMGRAEQLALSGDWKEGVDILEKLYLQDGFQLNPLMLVLFFERYKNKDFRGAIKILHGLAKPRLWTTQVYLAATHGQLGNITEAKSAVLQLASLRPKFEKEIDKDLKKWAAVEGLIEELKEGLRKAGLAV